MKINTRLMVVVAGALVVAALVVHALTRRTVVEAARVRRGDLTASLSATGVVEGLDAAVAPKFMGRVEEVLVEEGDRVESGQTLARLSAAQELAAPHRTLREHRVEGPAHHHADDLVRSGG